MDKENDELMEKIGVNIERYRLENGMSQEQMASAIDVSYATYRRIISGETGSLKPITIKKIYQMTGKMLFELCDDYDCDNRLVMFSKTYNMPIQTIKAIEGMVDFENAFAKTVDHPDDYITVYVPTGNMEDGMIYDASNFEKINAATYRAQFGDKLHCGIRITSNHLHPVYNKDDILLISHRPVRDGETGIFANTQSGRIYIRKFRQTVPVQLEPINGYGQTILVNPDDPDDMAKWIKFGVVLAKMRIQ